MRVPRPVAWALAVTALVAASVASIAPDAASPLLAAPDPADTADDLAGTVIDGDTNRPIEGATVAVWRRDAPLSAPRADGSPPPPDLDWPSGPVRTVTTDAAGRFAFPAEPRAALRWLTIDAAGMCTEVVVAPAASLPPTIGMSAVPPERLLFLKRDPDGDPDRPVAGAEVFVFPKGTTGPLGARMKTAADRRVELRWDAGAAAFVAGPGVATWALRPREGTRGDRGVRPVLEGAPVAGTVSTPAGAPVAGADVVLTSRACRLGATTDAAGRFRIEGVPCDPVLADASRLTVDAPGCAHREILVHGGDQGVAVVVAPGASVRGRVAGAEPVGGVELTLRDASPPPADTGVPAPPPCTLTARADGTFEFDGVAPGFHVLAATTSDGRCDARTFEAVAGGAVPQVVLRLHAEVEPAALRVLGEDGKPLAGVTVTPPDATDGAVTGADGVAVVTIRPRATRPAEVRLSGGPLGEASVPARISREAAASGRADVVLTSTVALHLALLDAEGAAVERSSYVADVALGTAPGVAACEHGFVSIDREEITVPRSRAFRLHVHAIGVPGVDHDGDHTASEAKDGVLEVRLDRERRGARAHGRIVPPAGVEVGRWYVDARLAPDEATGVVSSPVGGVVSGETLTLRGLRPGRWSVFASCNAKGTFRPFVAERSFDVAAADADVDLGTVDITETTLRGVVTSGGRPVPGASVALRVGFEQRITTATRADGTWVLRVGQGTAGTLEASRDGYGAAGRPFRAGAGEAGELVLVPEGRLIVRNACDRLRFPLPLRVRSAGTVRFVRPDDDSREAVVEGLAAGPVEIAVLDPSRRRVVRADVVSGATTDVTVE